MSFFLYRKGFFGGLFFFSTEKDGFFWPSHIHVPMHVSIALILFFYLSCFRNLNLVLRVNKNLYLILKKLEDEYWNIFTIFHLQIHLNSFQELRFQMLFILSHERTVCVHIISHRLHILGPPDSGYMDPGQKMRTPVQLFSQLGFFTVVFWWTIRNFPTVRIENNYDYKVKGYVRKKKKTIPQKNPFGREKNSSNK